MAGGSVDSYVQSRRIGEAVVTVISEGTVAVPASAVFPAEEAAWLGAQGETDAAGLLVSDQLVLHVRLGADSIVIDPAFDEPGSRWSERFARRWPAVRRSPGLAAGLAAIGVRPESVTHVLITHAHDDHFAGVTVEREGLLVPRFPYARHLIGRADWEGNPRREDLGSDLATRLGAVEHAGLLDLVDGDREVAPGVTLLHAPGETPGHAIVRVRSGGESFFALGDLFHHACEVEHLTWTAPWSDPAAMAASRQRLLAEAVPSGATLLFTHVRFPGWGRIVSTAGGYRWEWA